MSTNTESKDTDTILNVSLEAIEVIVEARALEDDPKNTALKVSIVGKEGDQYSYSLELIDNGETEKTDYVVSVGEDKLLNVIVPQDSAVLMKGATLDVASDNSGGLVIKNPNKPDPLEGIDLDSVSEVAEKVKLVIEKAINPGLASHGGYCKLLGVDDSKAYVIMGGGCQGCAASAMTLKESITTMILDAVSDITEVIDSTDHEAGENPFYK